MIAHFSVASKNPKKTAGILATVIGGEVLPFPVVPGAWIAVAKDNTGVAIEVLPETMAHNPGAGEADPNQKPNGPQTMPWEVQIRPDGAPLRPTPNHVALSTQLGEAEILQLGKQAGWRSIGCERGGVFRVIELWVDNYFMIEVLTPAELRRYQAFMRLDVCKEMFAPALKS